MTRRRRDTERLSRRQPAISSEQFIADLGAHMSFDSPAGVMQIVGCLSHRSRPGEASFFFCDDDRQLCEAFFFERGEEVLEELVHFLCSPDEPEVSGLFIVTDRRGLGPVERPDDELRWMELVDSAREGATRLLDWWVLIGDQAQAYSVAEFAPIPAQW